LSIISTLNRSDAVRRDLAMDLLLRTQRPIKQIAAEVGFQNEKSLMRAFK
jgi:transcriptional regulator GlxA family with amidase domain